MSANKTVLNKTKKFAVLDAPGVKANVASKSSSSSSSAAASGRLTRPLDSVEGLFKSTLSVEEKVAIAMSVGEEVLMPEELTALYTAKGNYITGII